MLADLPQDWCWGSNHSLSRSHPSSSDVGRARSITASTSAFHHVASAASTWQGHPGLGIHGCVVNNWDAASVGETEDEAIVDMHDAFARGPLDITCAEREVGMRWLVLRLFAAVIPHAHGVWVDTGDTVVYNVPCLLFSSQLNLLR